MELDKIYNMDCIQGFKDIPDGSISLIVTDPPYKVTPKGNSGTMSGYWTSEQTNKGKIFDHNDIDIEEYLPEFYRILKEDAHCYIMCNNYNLQHFFDVIGKSDFHFVKLLAWDKGTAICGRYYMGQIEHIFFLRKGKDKPINDCGTSDLLSFANIKDRNSDGTNIHDSQKPVGLMRALIINSTQKREVVLDPFMGSGTTAIAAYKSGRHFIGFEKDPKYHKVAMERFGRECLGEYTTKSGKKVKELNIFDL